MALQLSPRAQRLVAKPLLTVVGTTRPDGTPQLNPVWFEYRDGYFWLNSASGRAWPRNLERDPRLTLLILDKRDDHYWVQIQGRVVEATREGAVEHINRLARRYTEGFQLRPGMERITFKVEPLRLYGEQID